MSGNLPRGAATHPDAPWNRPYPDWGCSECHWSTLDQPPRACPDCGAEVIRI